MKVYEKQNLLLFALVMIFIWSSCKKNDISIAPPLNDNSLPSASVGDLQIVKKDAKEIVFSMKVAVFKDSRNMENRFSREHFVLDTINLNGYKCFFANTATSLSGGTGAGNYSALMLMDQSGSINDTDPSDQRLTAAKTFVTNMGAGNNSWLWSFTSSNFTKYGDGFTTDTTTLLAQIENLRNKEGGGTPLYYSQYNAIQACADKGSAPNKALLTFTDGADNHGVYTSTQVSDFAVSKNVKLFNIGLGSSAPLSLLRQAVDGKGAFMYASEARQLISMFGNLGKLLDGSARFYNITWKAAFNNADGTFSSGTFRTNLRVKTPYNYTVVVPLEIRY